MIAAPLALFFAAPLAAITARQTQWMAETAERSARSAKAFALAAAALENAFTPFALEMRVGAGKQKPPQRTGRFKSSLVRRIWEFVHAKRPSVA